MRHLFCRHLFNQAVMPPVRAGSPTVASPVVGYPKRPPLYGIIGFISFHGNQNRCLVPTHPAFRAPLGQAQVIRLFHRTVHNDFIQARNFLKPLIAEGKQFYRAPSYRIVRLVYLLIQAELGHYDWIESEIRSLKRVIQNDRQSYRTEKLLFQFIQLYPLPAYEKKPASPLDSVEKENRTFKNRSVRTAIT